jgi:hypothetical protein
MGEYGAINLNINGSDSIVKWGKGSWSEREKEIPSEMGVVTFVLDADEQNYKPAERYQIYNLCHDYEWFINQRNNYQCICEIDYKGQKRKIALYAENFDLAASFHTGINNVSFEVYENKETGKLKAVHIHDEGSGQPYIPPKRYYARGMRVGVKDTPPTEIATPAFHFALYRTFSFADNRSLSERDCPEKVQIAFAKAVKNWIKFYEPEKNPNLAKRILLGMSLVARDIGKPYYDLVYKAIDLYNAINVDNKNYQNQMNYIPNEIGCGLGDCTRQEEKELLSYMLEGLFDDKMVAVLSKALWNNRKFIYNVDNEILFDYLDSVQQRMSDLKEDYKKGKQKKRILRDMATCMEYVLALFRLRSNEDAMINEKYLSLNNRTMRKIYNLLEEIVDMKMEVKSFLKLEISNKGAYKDIPDLVYALMVYITGYNAEGEIKISGLNDDDGIEV